MGTYSLNIPIFSGKDATSRLLESVLVFQFPPPNVSYKVYDFRLENKYELIDGPILAPPLRKKNQTPILEGEPFLSFKKTRLLRRLFLRNRPSTACGSDDAEQEGRQSNEWE